jgi:hypothetical protein
MPSDFSSDVKFEIGHILFIDIVGYSKLLIDEQSDQIQKLKEIVRGTEQFRLAKAEGKLLRLPTGDGAALVFRNSPEAGRAFRARTRGLTNDLEGQAEFHKATGHVGLTNVVSHTSTKQSSGNS